MYKEESPMARREQWYHRLPDDDQQTQIFIYEAPMRLWHWLNALCMVALTATGYLIGTPLPSYTGDPSVVYVMGWIRFVHLGAGYLFAVLWLMRIWWAIVGNGYARQLFIPRFWRTSWMEGLWWQLAWNLFLGGEAKRYTGLNPLAHITIILLYIIPSIVLILTGFAMYAEVAGHESWQYHLFGWMNSIFANTMDLHSIHRLSMWAACLFILIHVYNVVREDVVSRQSIVSAMLSGFRLFKSNSRR
jgi:Ni/Fe-hydrogenase 1 B-type cytochrome subunit